MPNVFTQNQVRLMCLTAGFSPADAKIASAIAMVEAPYAAGGRSYANADEIGDEHLANATWGYSFGFFQIRSLKAELNTGKSRDSSRLTSPEFNCRSALAIRKTQGWGAWSTYNSGQYQAYLQDDYPPPAGTHIVTAGESLAKIATKLGGGYAWTALAAVNGIVRPYTIFIGQALLLPWTDYTVRSGDTLTSVVARYGIGVTTGEVAEFNKLTNPDRLTVGQVLRIPRAIYVKFVKGQA